MFRQLKIRSKLLVVLAIPMLALTLVVTLGLVTLSNVKVGGPRYQELKVAESLTSDVNPPSQYIVEAFATVLEITETTLAVDFQPKIDHLLELEKQFEARHKYWVSTLPAGPLATALNDTAYRPAHAFFGLVTSAFIPPVQAGDRDEAKRVAIGPLARLYRNHRVAIDQVVQLADNEKAITEIQTDRYINNRTLLLLITVVGLAGLSLLVGIMVIRAISRPLRRLTAKANAIAEHGLPDAVAAAQEGSSAPPPAITVDTRDEIADLANAMTAMQSTALDLAVEQAMMRRNVAEMFVNLGRRNQGLLSRQLSFITELEQNERNTDTLDNLFRLDHLATRMRRNAESLLVLAGAEPARTWSKPVSVSDVVRSALSEIESYERVDLTNMEEATIRGHAAADLSHLLAEVLENATTFSPPTTRVTVVGKRRPEGYLISVVDQGIGMAPSDLAEANRRIAETARFDQAPSKVLGLYVVGRLASRHEISITLDESPAGGVAAKVVVPYELLEGAPLRTSPEPADDAVWSQEPIEHLATALPGAPEFERELRLLVGDEAGAAALASPPPAPSVTPDPHMPLMASVTTLPTGLHRRVRGAHLPDTGPPPSPDDVLPPPDPNAVRLRLARLADGVQRAHVGDAPPPPPSADELAAAGQPHLTAEPASPAGLTRRVRGANLPDTGPAVEIETIPARSAEQVRSVLSSFARGVAMGRRDAPTSEGDDE
ncbi:MAG: ATP-binding protein [Acidimicrobiales bacterium]